MKREHIHLTTETSGIIKAECTSICWSFEIKSMKNEKRILEKK